MFLFDRSGVSPNHEIVTDADGLNRMVRVMRSQKRRAIDFETSGLQWASGKRPIGYSMGVRSDDATAPYRAFYVPFAHLTADKQCDRTHAIAAFQDAQDGIEEVVGHNLKFDINHGRASDFPIRLQGVNIHDTFIQAHLIFEHRRLKLEHVVADLGGGPFGDPFESVRKIDAILRMNAKARRMGIEAYKNAYGHSENPVEIEGEYACRDVVHALFCDDEQRSEAMGIDTDFEESRRYLYDNEMALVWALADMEREGQLVDAAYLRSFAAELDEELERRAIDLSDRFEAAIDWRNDNEVRSLLYDYYHFPKISLTDSGKPAVDRSTILRLRAKHPEWAENLNELAEFNAYAKVRETYTTSLADLVCDDGRIHANFKQTGTKAGRLSAEQPNLQNIPVRHEYLAKRVRQAFIVEPGKARWFADYSQIELRILAWATGNKMLLNAYRSNAWERFMADEIDYAGYVEMRSHEEAPDIHALQAQNTFGSKETDSDWKVKRRAAKIINFGVPYGMGPQGLNTNPELLLPEDEAERYFQQYHRANPEIAITKERLFRQMLQHDYPYFVNWCGRTVHSADLRSPDRATMKAAQRSLFACLIQGGAAELTKISIVRLHRAGILTSSTVHDEIQGDCPAAEVRDVAYRVREIMEDFHGLFGSVPILCAIEWTDSNWSEKRDFEGEA